MPYRYRNRNRGTNQDNNKKAPNYERHGTTSDWASVGINAFLAACTLVAIYFTYQANQTSKDALTYAIKKDSIDKIHQDIVDMDNKIKDSINKDAIDSSLAIAKRNTNISLEAMKENQRIFENENYPYVRAEPIIPNLSGFTDFPYTLKNFGRVPIILSGMSVTIHFNEGQITHVVDSLKKVVITQKIYSSNEVLGANTRDTLGL